MPLFDPSKSLIINAEGQSNMKGVGNWLDISATGLYAAYGTARSTVIDAKLISRLGKVHGQAWTSDFIGDFYENTSGYNSHSIPDADTINMCYSFLIDLMAYLNGITYTKNVYYINLALGGTSTQVTSGTFDWGSERELSFEANEQLKEIIRFEKDVNGNDSQIINIWHQGESDQNDPTNHEARLQAYYDKKTALCGYPIPMFLGQLVPTNVARTDMNDVFFDFAASNTDVHVVGQDLPGGDSTWEKMESDDPDTTILAATPTSYTYAGDNTHYNWPAQILQGRQLYDLVMSKFFGI